MKKNVSLKRTILIVLAALMICVLLPSTAYAASYKKTRRTKSMKEYNASGKLIYSVDYTYDKKGNTTKYVSKSRNYEGKLSTNTTTISRKYNSNGTIKQVTYKYSSGGKDVTTYDSNGRIKKSVYTYKSNNKTVKDVTTYDTKSNGMIKSCTTKRDGKLVRKETYNKNGDLSKTQEYDSTGKKILYTTTYTSKYNKKGQQTQYSYKRSDGDSYTAKYTYDKNGRQSSRTTTSTYVEYDGAITTYTDKVTMKYTLNKDKMVKERREYDKDGKLSSRTVYTYTSKKY